MKFMGYYTKFELHAADVETRWPISRDMEYDITYRLENIAFGYVEREDFEKWGPQSFDAWTGDTMKWYDHVDDMIALSKEYPNLIFMLEGVGEEFPDAWRKWFHNGQYEESYAEVVYPKPSNPLFAQFNY